MTENKDDRAKHLYSLDEKFSEEEIKILKGVVERERAISWLSSSAKYIAGWILVVFGAWALFSQALANWISSILGNGPLQ